MASWFSGEALGSKFADLRASATSLQSSVLTNLDTATTSLKNNASLDQLKSACNNVDRDVLLSKLTLQSPELLEERRRIDEEERRKEGVRDNLAEILPWETRDEEMEILVDECREVVLGLSKDEDTFRGPFLLVGGLSKIVTKGDEGAKDGDRDEGEEEEEELDDDDNLAASKSASKLSKLEPLPALLSNFDLDTHVGLIQRMLKEDPINLVDMHSRLSAGGEREKAFWKNYFFHCAYARYEAGLSIDEIWVNSSKSDDNDDEEASSRQSSAAGSNSSDFHHDGSLVSAAPSEEEVVFDDSSSSSEVLDYDGASSSSAVPPTSTTLLAHAAALETTTAATTATTKASLPTDSPDSGTSADYEFVPDLGGDDDGVMDELEAEIAAALGD